MTPQTKADGPEGTGGWLGLSGTGIQGECTAAARVRSRAPRRGLQGRQWWLHFLPLLCCKAPLPRFQSTKDRQGPRCGTLPGASL